MPEQKIERKDPATARMINKFSRIEARRDYSVKTGTTFNMHCPVDYPSFGLKKEDNLLCEVVGFYEENQIGVWSIGDDKTAYLATAYNNFGDVCLVSHTGKISRFKPNSLLLIGIVKGFERKLEFSPEIKPVAEEAEPDKSEQTVICEDCGTKLTGRPDFLRGMGWRIKKSGAYCVSCW